MCGTSWLESTTINCGLHLWTCMSELTWVNLSIVVRLTCRLQLMSSACVYKCCIIGVLAVVANWATSPAVQEVCQWNGLHWSQLSIPAYLTASTLERKCLIFLFHGVHTYVRIYCTCYTTDERHFVWTRHLSSHIILTVGGPVNSSYTLFNTCNVHTVRTILCIHTYMHYVCK